MLDLSYKVMQDLSAKGSMLALSSKVMQDLSAKVQC